MMKKILVLALLALGTALGGAAYADTLINGAEMAKSLDYVPIPGSVYQVMEQGWAKDINCNGQAMWK